MIKQGKTAILQPKEMVDLNCQVFLYKCSHLIDSLKGREIFGSVCHSWTMIEVRGKNKEEKKKQLSEILIEIRSGFKVVTYRLYYLKDT